MNRYAYFMLRVPRDDKPDVDLNGLIERLDTGEKRAFASAGELLAFIAGAERSDAKLPRETAADKQDADPAEPDPLTKERALP